MIRSAGGVGGGGGWCDDRRSVIRAGRRNHLRPLGAPRLVRILLLN